MDKKGFTLMELLAVIVILGIIAAIAIPSYNTISSAIKESQKDNLVALIEIKASRYAFDTGKTMIFVDELIKEGYIDSDDEEGNLLNPVDNERLNCYIVEMNKESDHYNATFIDENYDNDGICDLDKLEERQEEVNIEVQNGTEVNNWYKGSVTLKALSSTINIDCVNSRCVWTSSGGASYIGVDTIEVNNPIGVLKTTYTFQLTSNTEGDKQIKRYKDTISLNIDNEAPIIYQDETFVTDRYVYTDSKKVTIYASDGSGSGINGYNLSIGDVNCNNVALTYKNENSFTVTSNGDYTICVKDNVGNTSKSKLMINYIS